MLHLVKELRADDTDGVFAAASAMGLGGDGMPRPIRLAAGGAGVSPSKHMMRAPTSAVDIGDDDVTHLMTDEQLIESILEGAR